MSGKLLENKVAVVYGAAGPVGRAIAAAFAREGAKAFLSGRKLANVEMVANEIRGAGGVAEAAEVDALDEAAIEQHLGEVIDRAGRIDISFNAIGIPQAGIQGIPLTDLPLESFAAPINTYLRSYFLTARAAARHMLPNRSGVVISHTPEPARLGLTLVGGMVPAWAAMEGLSRSFSAEWAPQGVRSIVLRSTGLPETKTIDVVFGIHADALGVSREQFQAMLESMSHRRRSTSLAELADAAVFVASDRAQAMTGTVANLTGGMVVD